MISTSFLFLSLSFEISLNYICQLDILLTSRHVYLNWYIFLDSSQALSRDLNWYSFDLFSCTFQPFRNVTSSQLFMQETLTLFLFHLTPLTFVCPYFSHHQLLSEWWHGFLINLPASYIDSNSEFTLLLYYYSQNEEWNNFPSCLKYFMVSKITI